MTQARSLAGIVVVAGLLSAAGMVHACGYHGIVEGLRTSHPKSLQVTFALLDAYERQRLQRLPPLPAKEGLERANQLLTQFSRTFTDESQAPFSMPSQRSVAILLVEHGLWSRLTRVGDEVQLTLHVDGPASGEVVVVTGESAIEAFVTRKLTIDHCENQGVFLIVR